MVQLSSTNTSPLIRTLHTSKIQMNLRKIDESVHFFIRTDLTGGTVPPLMFTAAKILYLFFEFIDSN